MYLGDADGNDSVDATDARLILQAAAQLCALEGNAVKAADMDNDGTISARDAGFLFSCVGTFALGHNDKRYHAVWAGADLHD